ncbi:MAG: ABC transporter substrate-binding protein [Muribaculaceae bacterium]|nr:ABC transporter substrate-binding protein [Muribaculaceae bacterium]
MNRLIRLIIPAAALLSGLYSCSNRSDSCGYDDFDVADTLTHHSSYLTMADLGNGTVLVDIADPWGGNKALARYALVHRDSTIPQDLDDSRRIIRTPVSRMAVCSSVHTGALLELGALPSVVAVADAAYFPASDTISSLISLGKISDIGNSAALSAEKIAEAGVSALLRSPMQGTTSAAMPQSVVPVEMADYMETSPIGRAEWILLLGELAGRRREAQEIFTAVIDRYSSLTFKAAGAQSPKPKVLTEAEQLGIWYVPAGKSYAARLLADAGADYPWADSEGTGSLQLSLEKVAEKAIDADVWLIRTYGFTPTAAWLKSQNPRYASFRPVATGTVYGCDSELKPIFSDMAFHPDRVLAEYIAIFHPEVMPGYSLRYFSRQ